MRHKQVFVMLSVLINIFHKLVFHQLSCYNISGEQSITETGVSFDTTGRSRKDSRDLRSWSFYQLEQFLSYKAVISGSTVIKVRPDYTSKRCPKCGRIHKENRNHELHEYICDSCGYRSNDDRVGAMNINELGTMYVSGDAHPRFGLRKKE